MIDSFLTRRPFPDPSPLDLLPSGPSLPLDLPWFTLCRPGALLAELVLAEAQADEEADEADEAAEAAAEEEVGGEAAVEAAVEEGGEGVWKRWRRVLRRLAPPPLCREEGLNS